MPRMIDADAVIADMTNRYCMDCSKRKGMRNGKLKLVYAIGEAPCRACGVGDAIDDIESAPTIEALEKRNEPKRPKWFTDIHNPTGAYKCGVCEERIVEKDVDFYCPKCGQAVKWE